MSCIYQDREIGEIYLQLLGKIRLGFASPRFPISRMTVLICRGTRSATETNCHPSNFFRYPLELLAALLASNYDRLLIGCTETS